VAVRQSLHSLLLRLLQVRSTMERPSRKQTFSSQPETPRVTLWETILKALIQMEMYLV
jgi:hypothetical protein